MAEQPQSPQSWERATLEKLANGALHEQRKARRWGIFFKLFGVAYLIFIAVMLFDFRGATDTAGKHTALVELAGVIEAKGQSNGDRVTGALQNAFKDKNTQGVIVRINSPGGSPVQAGIIYDEMRRLRAKYPNIPLYAVVEDLCASGGYYVAAGADKIYVDKASLIGSIGVILGGFGFTEVMEKVGVERRLTTSGENKAFLDPFAPMSDKHRQFAQTMADDIHKQFIDVVKAGRGKRLKEDDPALFSGLVWTGEKSVELGLADALGSVDSVARDIIKAEKVVDFTEKENVAERLAKRFGMGAAQALGFTLDWRGPTLR